MNEKQSLSILDLQIKYQVGFSKAAMAKDLFDIIFEDETPPMPMEKIEIGLLKAADFVMQREKEIENRRHADWLILKKDGMYNEARFGKNKKNNNNDDKGDK